MASREYEALMQAFVDPLVLPGDSTATARDKLNAVHGHPVAEDVRIESGTAQCETPSKGLLLHPKRSFFERVSNGCS